MPPAAGGRITLIRSVLVLALPIMLGGAVQTSYHLVNTFWVGRLGAEAVAVVAVCLPVNLLLISLGSGLSLAGSILVAQHYGGGDTGRVNHVAAQSLTTMIALALLLAAGGYIAAPYILELMGVDAEIFAEALTYLRITFGSLVFLLLSSIYQAILRGLGQARAPLRIIMASVAINAVLDPLLIFGWGPVAPLGVIGAACATMITQAITAYAGIRLMLQPRFGLSLKPVDLLPDWPLVVRLVRLGFPASIEQSMQALTVSVMTILAAKFGTVTLAAYGVAFRIITFTIIPSFSVSMAVSILVGQSTGAGDHAQSRRIALAAAATSFTLMSAVAIIFLLAAVPIVSFFVPRDPELIEHGTLVLRIFALSLPLSSVQMALTGTFRGAGQTLTSMLLTLLGIWLVQIPLALLLSQENLLGETGLWWAGFAASIVNTTIALLYFRSRRWQRR